MDNEGWRDWAKNSAGMWDWKSLCWTLFPLGDEKCSVRTLTTVKEETRLKLPFLSAILRYRVLKNTRFYSLNGCLFCKCGLHEFAKKRFIQTAHWHWRSPCYTVFNKFLTTFWWFLTQQIKLQNMNVKWLRKTESQQKVSKKISKNRCQKFIKLGHNVHRWPMLTVVALTIWQNMSPQKIVVKGFDCLTKLSSLLAYFFLKVWRAPVLTNRFWKVKILSCYK